MSLVSLVELVNVGIVLPFPQALVRRMTEFPVRCPGAKLDLGDQGRLDPDNVGSSGMGQGRLLSLPSQRVQYLPQPDDLGSLEARADASDVDEIAIAVGGKR